MLGETIDNLVGGADTLVSIGSSQLNENNKGQSTPIVPKELNENLFEGGDQCSKGIGDQCSKGIGDNHTGDNTGDNQCSEGIGNNNNEDTDDNYTMFLHRLKTKELYTDARRVSAHPDVVSGGKTPKEANSLQCSQGYCSNRPLEEVNDDETNNIDVLPMFPYLVRY